MRLAASKVRGLWQWWWRLPRKLTVPIMVALVGLFSFSAFKMVSAYEYMENNPNFCRACHVMEEAWDRWETSEHRSVGCHSCHKTGAIEGAELLITFSFGRPEAVGKHATIQDEVCEKCHESNNPRWLQVAATAGHFVHAEEQNVACTKCHGVSLHRFHAPGAICTVCHQEKHIEVAGMATMHCTACHDYLAEGETLRPDRKDCLDCHGALAGQKVTWPANAPMQFKCSQCHQPHQQAAPVVGCLSCHANRAGLHVGIVHAAAKCQTCHQPHRWKTEERATCLACHPDKALHNPGKPCAQCHDFRGVKSSASLTPFPLAGSIW